MNDNNYDDEKEEKPRPIEKATLFDQLLNGKSSTTIMTKSATKARDRFEKILAHIETVRDDNPELDAISLLQLDRGMADLTSLIHKVEDPHV